MNVLRMRWHKGAQQQEAQHRVSWTRISQSKQICMYTSFLTLPGQSRGLPVGLEELAARDELLDDHASDANHGQAAMVELLGLHLDLLLRVRWVQSQRGQREVARDTICLQGPPFVAANTIWSEWLLEYAHGLDFHGADCKDNKGPECFEWCLLECEVGRVINVAAEEWVEFLRDRKTQSSEHSDTAMLELGLAEELRTPLGASRVGEGLAEAERIEKANWAADACGHVCSYVILLARKWPRITVCEWA